MIHLYSLTKVSILSDIPQVNIDNLFFAKRLISSNLFIAQPNYSFRNITITIDHTNVCFYSEISLNIILPRLYRLRYISPNIVSSNFSDNPSNDSS